MRLAWAAAGNAGKRTKSFAFVSLFIALPLFLGGCVGVATSSDQPKISSATAPLTLGSPATTNITANSALITWTSSAPASSQVQYGATSAYGSQTALNATMVTSHTQSVTGLQPGQLYHYRAASLDANHNSATSGDQTFTTLAAPDTTPPTVSITAPVSGANVSGTVVVSATATDDVAVASVQFRADGNNIGAAVMSSPYSISLDTTALSNGSHTLSAVAADTSNNSATSAGVSINVNNSTSTIPNISGLSPTSGAVGTSVTITGTSFGSTQGTSTVKFNGTTATPTSWSGTSIMAPVPGGATTGNVVVTVGGQASNGVTFTVSSAAPSISSLSPTSGGVGVSVTITGANFGSTQGTSTVKFNGTTATPTSWSGTSIMAPVPNGASTGNVVVTVGSQSSNGVPFTVTSGTGGPGIPTLVQHVSQSNAQGYALTAYRIRLPNTTQSGNCLIVGVNSASSGVTPTVTDDHGDVYTQVVSNSDGNQAVSLFVALNIVGGVQNITVQFSSATAYVAAVASEFYNVATANAVDGSHATNGVGTSITAGSFTPTTSGDLIYQFTVQDSTSNPIISFMQGSNPWSLLSADLMDSMSAQYQVQSTASPLNPGMSMSPANGWNSAAMALKSASSGSDIAGMHVVHLQHNALPANTGSPIFLQFPSTGNLIVVSWIGAPGHTVTGVSDSNGNSYSQIGSEVGNNDSGENQMFYAPSAATGPTMSPSLTTSGTDIAGSTVQFFDISGAAGSPLDSVAGWQTATGGQSASGSVTAVSITPSTPGGLVITSIGVASNTVSGVSPGNFLSSVTDPETSPWPNDENNGWAIEYNPTAGPVTLIWNTSGGPVGYWASVAAAFKGVGH